MLRLVEESGGAVTPLECMGRFTHIQRARFVDADFTRDPAFGNTAAAVVYVCHTAWDVTLPAFQNRMARSNRLGRFLCTVVGVWARVLVRDFPDFDPPPCAPTNGRPGFPFGFLGAGGRLPKTRRGRVFTA